MSLVTQPLALRHARPIIVPVRVPQRIAPVPVQGLLAPVLVLVILAAALRMAARVEVRRAGRLRVAAVTVPVVRVNAPALLVEARRPVT